MLVLALVVDYEKILANGITPLIVLIIIGIIIKKALWPRIAQYLDDARNDRIEIQQSLKSRAESLEKRETTQLNKFTDTLDALKETLEISGRRQESQILIMEETLKLTKDNNDILRERR